nr:nucleolar protein 16 [Ipomoea batatas]
MEPSSRIPSPSASFPTPTFSASTIAPPTSSSSSLSIPTATSRKKPIISPKAATSIDCHRHNLRVGFSPPPLSSSISIHNTIVNFSPQRHRQLLSTAVVAVIEFSPQKSQPSLTFLNQAATVVDPIFYFVYHRRYSLPKSQHPLIASVIACVVGFSPPPLSSSISIHNTIVNFSPQRLRQFLSTATVAVIEFSPLKSKPSLTFLNQVAAVVGVSHSGKKNGSIIENYKSFGIVSNPNFLSVCSRTSNIVEFQPLDSGSDLEEDDQSKVSIITIAIFYFVYNSRYSLPKSQHPLIAPAIACVVRFSPPPLSLSISIHNTIVDFYPQCHRQLLSTAAVAVVEFSPQYSQSSMTFLSRDAAVVDVSHSGKKWNHHRELQVLRYHFQPQLPQRSLSHLQHRRIPASRFRQRPRERRSI